jgi:3-isopropylmalate/(R)-2-methylmalate dehydratase large subunit
VSPFLPQDAAAPRTLFEQIWQRHVVVELPEGESLLYVDRCLIHEGSRPAFTALDRAGRALRSPAQVVACADHYLPTTVAGRRGVGTLDPTIAQMVQSLESNAHRHGCTLIGVDDPRQGILHVVAPEQGLTQPGMVICGGDSHTSTHGAFGALAFGIGASEVMHVMATQTIWQAKARSMRITVNARLASGASAKDLILRIIGQIGTGGATGHVIEYVGPAIRALSMEQRMTVCNMSIEAGARAGMIAPDETTFAWLEGRPMAPQGRQWEHALGWWRSLASHDDAAFDREVAIEGEVQPMTTWGTSPEQCSPLPGRVPDPDREPDAARRSALIGALDYMALLPNQPLSEVAVDRVFIGSCTNGRLEDLRVAADVLRGRRTKVPGLVVPGSSTVKRQAQAEGLDRVFLQAGLEWRESGCSLCTGVNGADFLQPGERCASTSNRNFPGRQGPGSRTHLMSPASVAATAVLGRLASVADLP